MKVKIGEIKEYDAPNKLLLDYDVIGENVEKQLQEIKDCLAFVGVEWVNIRFELSSSGEGYHAIIILRDDFPLIHRLFFQLLLGSDAKREKINYVRESCITSVMENPYKNLLFSNKKEAILFL